MWVLGGHLGARVADLVDGRLDARESDRAWDHVLRCGCCRAAVEQESWVKDQLLLSASASATPDQPPATLTQTLSLLAARTSAEDSARAAAQTRADEAWAQVRDLERRHVARRAGVALAGVGSLSLAVVGVLTVAPTAPTVVSPATREASVTGSVDRPVSDPVLTRRVTRSVP